MTGEQLDIEDMHHGFAVQFTGGAWRLVDRATFNNWGIVKRDFPDRDSAIDYARRCDDFKRGRRLQVEYHSWEMEP